MVCWSGSSPARYVLIRVAVTLSVVSDSLSLPSSHSMFGVGGFEELDMDMFRIIISLFIIAYL
jgi:hypothetical protein